MSYIVCLKMCSMRSDLNHHLLIEAKNNIPGILFPLYHKNYVCVCMWVGGLLVDDAILQCKVTCIQCMTGACSTTMMMRVCLFIRFRPVGWLVVAVNIVFENSLNALLHLLYRFFLSCCFLNHYTPLHPHPSIVINFLYMK